MPEIIVGYDVSGNLLGSKGASLAEMTDLRTPVPPGFTITTEACWHYLCHGSVPGWLGAEVTSHLALMEAATGRLLGDPADPLLLSVRSGAKFSMSGRAAIANIGLSDDSVEGLARQAGDQHFAWDSYRRMIQTFGKTVLGIDGERFSHALASAKKARGVTSDNGLGAGDLRDLARRYQAIVRQQTGRDFPQDPREQLDLAIRAVFDSWSADRVALGRHAGRMPPGHGTAVNVAAMVFGNQNGVAAAKAGASLPGYALAMPG